MDKTDFRLNDEQKGLVKQFIDAYVKMKASGVALVLCQEREDSYVTFINRNGAVDFGNEDETEGYENERIDITDVVYNGDPWWFSIDYMHNVWNDDKMYAVPEGTELY